MPQQQWKPKPGKYIMQKIGIIQIRVTIESVEGTVINGKSHFGGEVTINNWKMAIKAGFAWPCDEDGEPLN